MAAHLPLVQQATAGRAPWPCCLIACCPSCPPYHRRSLPHAWQADFRQASASHSGHGATQPTHHWSWQAIPSSIPSTQVLAATLSHASWMFTAAGVLTIGATGRVEAGTLVLLLAGSHSRLGRLGQLAARLAAQQRRSPPPFNRHCPCCSLCLRLGGRRLLIGPCLPPVNGLACVAVGHALVLDSGLIILHSRREDISSDCRVQGAWQALLFSMQPLQQLQRRAQSQQRPSSSG